MIILSIYGLIVNVLLVVFFIYGYKVIINQRAKIESLNKEINDSRKQPTKQNTDPRRNFRVEISHLPCEVTFIEIENDKMKNLENSKITAILENVSSTGLKFDSKYNFPVKYKIKIRVKFELKEELFSFKGYIVRKEEHVKNKMNSYGIQFIETGMKDQQQLIVKLNQIEAERRKKKIS
ncbi:PilZ domain-containing protein [Virgibacillus byunsanensis]|uniref:PilZ domain-containing protein n=1 Tax=Virgibacillus byunsanensis TaxID=570945 RepID=A0ABW3LQK9_9BACI